MIREFFKKINVNAGFTILETMIAVSLFLVVVLFGMTSLLNATNVHNKSEDMRSIMDNLSFVMEDVSRNLRTGYDYQCFRKGTDTSISSSLIGEARSCADGWAIAFESALGNTTATTDQWVYALNQFGKILKSTDGASTFTQMTPNEVVIDQISGFSVLGALPPPDQQQPLVIIKLVGTITYKNIVTPFSIETSVSQRLVDI